MIKKFQVIPIGFPSMTEELESKKRKVQKKVVLEYLRTNSTALNG